MVCYNLQVKLAERPGMLAQGHRKTLSVLLRFLISTIIFLIATLLIYDNVSLNHALTRGIETGNKVKVQPIASPSLGTDLNLPTEANTAEIKTAIARVADAGLHRLLSDIRLGYPRTTTRRL